MLVIAYVAQAFSRFVVKIVGNVVIVSALFLKKTFLIWGL